MNIGFGFGFGYFWGAQIFAGEEFTGLYFARISYSFP